ncbi:hypothetical protein AS026_06400 [Rhizobium altiplani]|uniref:Uncharacterized protein n=1 Tax=Rhizobium altiplani TaxID=1864509 RepID=A0A120FKV6_9HYPH|nr:hypothetical protein AS026_06400 [Rhizobium altiplani]
MARFELPPVIGPDRLWIADIPAYPFQGLHDICRSIAVTRIKLASIREKVSTTVIRSFFPVAS